MLLVFGGTTEGRRVAIALAAARYPFVYSTRSAVEMIPLPGMRLRHGPLSVEALVALGRTERIRGIVHAGHPFAEELHRTIGAAAAALDVPLWRFERTYPSRQRTEAGLRYVRDFPAALAALEELGREPLLACTGVQTIAKLRPWWELRAIWFQILDRPESLALAAAAGFPRERLLPRPPYADPAELERTLRQVGAQVLLTKESGESGYQLVKEEAACRAGLPLLIVERPPLPAGFVPVRNEAELLAALVVGYSA